MAGKQKNYINDFKKQIVALRQNGKPTVEIVIFRASKNNDGYRKIKRELRKKISLPPVKKSEK